GALVRHVQQIDSRQLLEQLGNELPLGSIAGGAIRQGSWLLPGEGNEFLEVLRRNRRVDCEYSGRPAEQRDMGKVAQRVVGRPLRQQGRDDVRGDAGYDERVAVGV